MVKTSRTKNTWRKVNTSDVEATRIRKGEVSRILQKINDYENDFVIDTVGKSSNSLKLLEKKHYWKRILTPKEYLIIENERKRIEKIKKRQSAFNSLKDIWPEDKVISQINNSDSKQLLKQVPAVPLPIHGESVNPDKYELEELAFEESAKLKLALSKASLLSAELDRKPVDLIARRILANDVLEKHKEQETDNVTDISSEGSNYIHLITDSRAHVLKKPKNIKMKRLKRFKAMKKELEAAKMRYKKNVGQTLLDQKFFSDIDSKKNKILETQKYKKLQDQIKQKQLREGIVEHLKIGKRVFKEPLKRFLLKSELDEVKGNWRLCPNPSSNFTLRDRFNSVIRRGMIELPSNSGIIKTFKKNIKLKECIKS